LELVVADQIRLHRTPDGKIWTNGWGGYAQFSAYLGPFDAVSIACRLEDVSAPGKEAIRCDGPDVTFIGLPHYVGPSQYLQAAANVRRSIREAYRPRAAYLLRLPSQIGFLFFNHLKRMSHPPGVLVVADAFKDFERKSCGHPAWRILQWRYTRSLRTACTEAPAIAYVTQRSLQNDYPPGNGYSTNFSDVTLTDDWYVELGRVFTGARNREWRVIHVGSFTQLYKGQDTLLRAIASCRHAGLSIRVTFVGDGRYRTRTEQLASELGLAGCVRFTGDIPHGRAVKDLLDEADLFVLPSRTEGLPRSLLEAMARGLPCIATSVGGVPELLDSRDLVPRDRPDLLSERITQAILCPQEMAEMSARNLAVARQYHWAGMGPRRLCFLDHLRQTTEAWIEGAGGRG
jgi:hypothetical protein